MLHYQSERILGIDRHCPLEWISLSLFLSARFWSRSHELIQGEDETISSLKKDECGVEKPSSSPEYSVCNEYCTYLFVLFLVYFAFRCSEFNGTTSIIITGILWTRRILKQGFWACFLIQLSSNQWTTSLGPLVEVPVEWKRKIPRLCEEEPYFLNQIYRAWTFPTRVLALIFHIILRHNTLPQGPNYTFTFTLDQL